MLSDAGALRLEGGAEVRRTEEQLRALTQRVVRRASTIVASESSGGTGILLLELSPATGVPTPGEAGFPAAGFFSDRDLVSSMLQAREGVQ